MLSVASTIFCYVLKQTDRQKLCCFWISSHCIQYHHQVLVHEVLGNVSSTSPAEGFQNNPQLSKPR